MLTPCFWFASEAVAAFSTYEKAFAGSKITNSTGFLSELSLGASKIAGMNGGPSFVPNRSISIYAELLSVEAVDFAYEVLKEGGEILMELKSYDWSKRYGWVQDKWGVNWQLTLAMPGEQASLSPAMMFAYHQQGRAREAISFYQEVFADAQVLFIADAASPGPNDQPEVLHAQLMLGGNKVVMFDSGVPQQLSFTEGASLMLPVETQAEIDHYWDSMVAGGGAEGRCGWCKDRFGVSWQIFPSKLGQWLSDPQKGGRAGAVMRTMKKLDLAALRDA